MTYAARVNKRSIQSIGSSIYGMPRLTGKAMHQSYANIKMIAVQDFHCAKKSVVSRPE
jgi:hypothetical protein